MLNKLKIPVPLWTGKNYQLTISLVCIWIIKMIQINLVLDIDVSFREGMVYCFTAVRLSFARSTNSFRSFSPQMSHILKWNLVSRFIIRISFWYDQTVFERVMFLGLRKIPIIFAVSIHFYSQRLHYWNEICIQIYHKNI